MEQVESVDELTDEEVVAITDAMKANAVIMPTVEINDVNWKESVNTICIPSSVSAWQQLSATL